MQEAKVFPRESCATIIDLIREECASVAQVAFLAGLITRDQLKHIGPLGWACLGTDVNRRWGRLARPVLEPVTAEKVRLLREQTGEGLMHCKKALTSCGGDLSAAAEWLRRQGQAVVRRSTPAPLQTATEVALARDAADARLREMLREAYEEGYSDGQNSPNGYSSKEKRDKCVADILARESGQ